VDNQSVENAIPNQSVIAVAPGSWAYVRRGQPNEESDYESNCRCQECPSDGGGSKLHFQLTRSEHNARYVIGVIALFLALFLNLFFLEVSGKKTNRTLPLYSYVLVK